MISSALALTRFPLGDGGIGRITQRLFTAYMNVVRGVDRRFSEWRTPVNRTVTV